jgi:hypothetical protein
MENERNYCVGFEVFIAVVVKSSPAFWDITPCSQLKVNRPFGGTFRLHLLDRKMSRVRNQRVGRWQAEHSYGIHGVISRKIELFKMNNFIQYWNSNLIYSILYQWQTWSHSLLINSRLTSTIRISRSNNRKLGLIFHEGFNIELDCAGGSN